MGIPVQLFVFLDDWLSKRSAYCKINKMNSELFEVNERIVLGPLLFDLFISPLADMHHPQLMQMTTTF